MRITAICREDPVGYEVISGKMALMLDPETLPSSSDSGSTGT